MHRLVVRHGLDKRHAHCRLAALTAVSRDATVAPKLGHVIASDLLYCRGLCVYFSCQARR